MTAFVSSLTPSSFVGKPMKTAMPIATQSSKESTDNYANGIAGLSMRMKFGINYTLYKYLAAASRVYTPHPFGPPNISPKFEFFLEQSNRTAMSYSALMSQLRMLARAPKPQTTRPNVGPADVYMAQCISSQYKASGCATGVYNVRCTEGTTKLQADVSRVHALANDFRRGQRPIAAQFGEFYAAAVVVRNAEDITSLHALSKQAPALVNQLLRHRR